MPKRKKREKIIDKNRSIDSSYIWMQPYWHTEEASASFMHITRSELSRPWFVKAALTALLLLMW